MGNPHLGQPVLVAGPPPTEARAVAILVHGRGRTPDEMLDLIPRLGDPDVAYLAPTADEGSWYPFSFLQPVAENEPRLSFALAAYGALLDGLRGQGIAQRRLVLLGFSQGACLTAEYAVRNPGRYGGVVIFTGGLIGPPGTLWPTGGDFAGTPVFIGGSIADPFVPLWRMRESAEQLRAMGAAVSEGFYDGDDHVVSDSEIAAARAILSTVGGEA